MISTSAPLFRGRFSTFHPMPLGRLRVGLVRRARTPLPCPALGCQRTSQAHHHSTQRFIQDSIQKRRAVHSSKGRQHRQPQVILGGQEKRALQTLRGFPLLRLRSRWLLALGVPCVLAHRLPPPLVASVSSLPGEISAKGGRRLGAKAPW